MSSATSQPEPSVFSFPTAWILKNLAVSSECGFTYSLDYGKLSMTYLHDHRFSVSSYNQFCSSLNTNQKLLIHLLLVTKTFAWFPHFVTYQLYLKTVVMQIT
jgi:hypothetical protein